LSDFDDGRIYWSTWSTTTSLSVAKLGSMGTNLWNHSRTGRFLSLGFWATFGSHDMMGNDLILPLEVDHFSDSNGFFHHKIKVSNTSSTGDHHVAVAAIRNDRTVSVVQRF
jgi:hypothetical protein